MLRAYIRKGPPGRMGRTAAPMESYASTTRRVSSRIPKEAQETSESIGAGAAEQRGARYGVGYSEADREVAMEREEAEFRALEKEEAAQRAANERITVRAEELRKAELVRDRLEGLAQLMGSYPEGHEMRARLEDLHVDRALEGVNEDIRVLVDALQYPRGT